VGLVTGTIAGLASITPASGSVGPIEALIIGGVAGIMCQELCSFVKNKMNIDDTLDVFAVHGIGGMFGSIMLAVFGHASWTAQLGGLAVVGIWTIVVTTIIVLVVKAIFPIRVGEEDEYTGLDLTSHGERAYDMSS
jgi:Amt family ammonium transporter